MRSEMVPDHLMARTSAAWSITNRVLQPVATALEAYPSLLWLRTIVEIGAIAGLSSVILVMIMGQSRIFYSMSRDGLIPDGRRGAGGLCGLQEIQNWLPLGPPKLD